MGWFGKLMTKEIELTTEETNKLIRSGEVDEEDLPFLLKAVKEKSLPWSTAFETFYAIKNFKHFKRPKLFKNLFGLSEQEISDLFSKEVVKVKFPVVKYGKGKIITAHLVPLQNSVLNFSKVDDELLSVIKRATGKGFAVTFDSSFSQDSFMLAVVAGLLAEDKHFLSHLSFTGSVDCYRNILSVGLIGEKKKISEEQNLKLITAEDVKYLKQLKCYLKRSIPVPFPLMVGKHKEAVKIFFRNFEKETKLNCDAVSKFSGISLSDMGVVKGNSLENSLEAFHKLLEEEFSSKLLKVTGRREDAVFHITGVVSSLMYGAGIIFGVRKKAVLYHYQDGEYHPILAISRELKEIKRSRNWIKTSQIEKGSNKEAAITLHIASHNPLGSTRAFVKNYLKNASHFYITLKENTGNVPLNREIWKTVVSEIYSELNRLRSEYMVERFHIFLSIPCPMAFALGACAGKFIPATIYNYIPEKNSYSAVIETDKSKNIF
ncbi:SAVED domain-containing protein [Desulfurobacterium sp.]|uniref:SAVED domain-containing protein n=1 Tax=Desulfurobacterium sp. TaxID=2004706 RepID=UPI0026235628|nr:SAVED domain-containing protein [Desulfurobacterium sp.]